MERTYRVHRKNMERTKKIERTYEDHGENVERTQCLVEPARQTDL